MSCCKQEKPDGLKTAECWLGVIMIIILFWIFVMVLLGQLLYSAGLSAGELKAYKELNGEKPVVQEIVEENK